MESSHKRHTIAVLIGQLWDMGIWIKLTVLYWKLTVVGPAHFAEFSAHFSAVG